MSRSDEIAKALHEVRENIPSGATLIVVTKTFPLSDVEILYQLGERNFGENRDEEGALKSAGIAEDAFWHFQGGIQSKKIRSIVSWADLIHSLDDLSHARKIDEAARGLGKRQAVLRCRGQTRGSRGAGFCRAAFDAWLSLFRIFVAAVQIGRAHV